MAKNRFIENMVYIPGSEFYAGNEKKWRTTLPGHKVYVAPFYINKYPVTNEEYGKVIGKWQFDRNKKNYPVTGLTFDEILEYCRLTGKRLPTETEWEKAARGDKDRRMYPWGNDFSKKKCTCRSLFFLLINRITAVDAHPEGVSPYGCFDMIGNVWEWTATTAGDDLYILKGGACTSPSRRFLAIPSRLMEHKNYAGYSFGFRSCLSE